MLICGCSERLQVRNAAVHQHGGKNVKHTSAFPEAAGPARARSVWKHLTFYWTQSHMAAGLLSLTLFFHISEKVWRATKFFKKKQQLKWEQWTKDLLMQQEVHDFVPQKSPMKQCRCRLCHVCVKRVMAAHSPWWCWDCPLVGEDVWSCRLSQDTYNEISVSQVLSVCAHTLLYPGGGATARYGFLLGLFTVKADLCVKLISCGGLLYVL